MKQHVTDYALYRWRYAIGYGFIALVVVMILGIAVSYVPGALRQAEMDSALTSSRLSVESLEPSMVINLPYQLLQRLSFMVLGVTTLSIKLPSIILGGLTCVGVFFLTRTWFRRNVGVLATVLAITTTQFLFLIQDGTPAISFSFVTIWLLTAGTYVTRNQFFSTFWKVVGCVLMATAVYVPLGIYVVLALLITASLHPHIRYILRKISRPRIILAMVLGLVSIAPLVYASIVDPTVALKLLGIPTGQVDLLVNVKTVAKDLFGFFSTSSSALLRPLYSLGVFILMIVGVYKLLTVKYTARSYIVLILSVCMIPLVVLNPQYLSSLYPLAVLMIATGIVTMVSSWYKLFPRNPYARIAGLIPLSVFALGMMFSGVMRYMNNYSYNPNVLSHYSSDLRLLDRYLAKANSTSDNTRLITTSAELPFYELVSHYDKRFNATTQINDAPQTAIMTHDAYADNQSSLEPTQIITNGRAENADRLYVYTTK